MNFENVTGEGRARAGRRRAALPRRGGARGRAPGRGAAPPAPRLRAGLPGVRKTFKFDGIFFGKSSKSGYIRQKVRCPFKSDGIFREIHQQTLQISRCFLGKSNKSGEIQQKVRKVRRKPFKFDGVFREIHQIRAHPAKGTQSLRI